ncbi:hypothetical protein BD779DRAFT_1469473 [Infundibulicybe gibba]|nr:hypothetical protein BD779DRAFT_1469473 [Infundibulicybe gibba]
MACARRVQGVHGPNSFPGITDALVTTKVHQELGANTKPNSAVRAIVRREIRRMVDTERQRCLSGMRWMVMGPLHPSLSDSNDHWTVRGVTGGGSVVATAHIYPQRRAVLYTNGAFGVVRSSCKTQRCRRGSGGGGGDLTGSYQMPEMRCYPGTDSSKAPRRQWIRHTAQTLFDSKCEAGWLVSGWDMAS